ncbi:AtzH-like domain-containing protein [Actinoplanes solisilvae]|uniref:AtzH-like domain-containing protein n=1 Tax=Actinoplanes solisilvae TaxID=2486853 RepID=UPI000FD94A9F|nr:AtzH-like domain-containing protein [Actinoplanes solisilvae]
MRRDDPEVLIEVAAAFEAYEKALVANDVEAMLGFFAEGTVRYGIADQQVGLDEQRAWRLAQPPLPPGRRLKDTIIQSYGNGVALVNTLFCYPGGEVLGRQSQTWVRLPHGWRIVAAHVSEPRA